MLDENNIKKKDEVKRPFVDGLYKQISCLLFY